MDVKVELHFVVSVLLALLLGGIIGWEREHHGRAAGIRTYGAIAVGACVFGLISLHGLPSLGIYTSDPSRIASNVVVGVGFLGAGVIFHKNGMETGGLTTAATLWSTAAVGLSVAFKMYTISVLVTLILFLMLWLPKLPWWSLISAKKRNY